ncbi:hypothetical protein FQZ97_1193670 [compost metagenome]
MAKLKLAVAYIPDFTSDAPAAFSLISIGKFRELSAFTEMKETEPLKVLSGKTGILISTLSPLFNCTTCFSFTFTFSFRLETSTISNSFVPGEA